MVQSSMGVASISQQFFSIGPEIFLALVLWNGERERFHTLHTSGTDPCQQNNIRIFFNIQRSARVTDKNARASKNK